MFHGLALFFPPKPNVRSSMFRSQLGKTLEIHRYHTYVRARLRCSRKSRHMVICFAVSRKWTTSMKHGCSFWVRVRSHFQRHGASQRLDPHSMSECWDLFPVDECITPSRSKTYNPCVSSPSVVVYKYTPLAIPTAICYTNFAFQQYQKKLHHSTHADFPAAPPLLKSNKEYSVCPSVG